MSQRPGVGVGHVHFRDGPLQPFGDFPQTILDHASLARRSSGDFSYPGMGQSIRPPCGASTRTFFVASKLLQMDFNRHLLKTTDAILDIKPNISEVM